MASKRSDLAASGRRRGTGPFDWSGGHPALDLVNTLDERLSGAPVETLATWHELVRFTSLAGLARPALAARLRRYDDVTGRSVVAGTRALREHLHAVLAATHRGRPPRRDDLDAIAAAIHAAHAARRLVAAAPPALAAWDWVLPPTPDVALHACALAVERLLVDEDRDRIRQCAAPDCGVFFLDASKGGRRHWCSMDTCGNRQKQRRWRAR